MAAAAVSQVTEQTLDINAPPAVQAKQPDIEYLPDRAKWIARTQRRLEDDPSLPTQPLPEGFPKKLNSPLVWEGSDWKDEEQWVYNLTKEDLQEIDSALRHFNGLGKPLGYISPSTFPLPTLGPKLLNLSRELHSGRGFCVLRTIPVSSYTRLENMIVYAGVSSHIGSLRGLQDKKRCSVMTHVKDLTADKSPNRVIGASVHTMERQEYHTDKGDIIALLSLETAEDGGVSKISSSWRVYNELAETRPDLIKTLSEPWNFGWFKGDPWKFDGVGGDDYTSRPLLFHQDSKIIIQYARRYFAGYHNFPRNPNIPITEAQAEALDALHFLAEKYALRLNFQKGDIEYINNLSIFHGRDGFKDSANKRRHLLRLWLRNEQLAWKLPEDLERDWKTLYYSIPPDEQRFPLEPEVGDGMQGTKN